MYGFETEPSTAGDKMADFLVDLQIENNRADHPTAFETINRLITNNTIGPLIAAPAQEVSPESPLKTVSCLFRNGTPGNCI